MRTVRLRLTLLYTGLFLVAGALLVALVYVLVRFSPFPGPALAPTAPGGGGPPAGTPGPDHVEQAVTLRRLLVNSLVAFAVAAFVAMVLGWFAAGRALRPLGAMTATVRRITAERLDRRLPVSGPDDELRRLAVTFNDLLDRLEGAFTAQRRFVANASHELRTPLTLQRATAEIALADPEADAESLRAVLGRMLAAGEHQERLIEALLTLARSQEGPHRRERLDLAVVTAQALRHEDDPGPRIEASLHPAPTFADPALIERLVANLLDNARRYNVPSGWVTAWTGVTGGRPTLRIRNSGPLIPAERVSLLLQPFQRLQSGRKAGRDGLGLGLSIVAAIAEAHHGTLEVRPLSEGGLDVTVALPGPVPEEGPA
ncbi:sensor histidine kinase [Microbispora triticiradicis]|uniref:sensor histidine kinase n=1 Tax=Microbispora triticiradicis TaxID=2200763 RepID=UPI001AD6D0E3|nr:ATP-binding protein [Microbispora triticiradicis]